MKPAVLRLKNLSYYRLDNSGRRVDVLTDLDLECEEGQFILVSGSSGSGKSSLLSVIAGVLPAWGGYVEGGLFLEGKELADIPSWQRSQTIGYLFQNPASQFLFPSVKEECAFALENLHWPPDEIDAAVASSLRRVGIEDLAFCHPQRLSGGEQVLVALAALYVRTPKILLLDEPLASLDVMNTERVVAVLSALKKDGCTLIVCDHQTSALEILADRHLSLEKGRWEPAAAAGKRELPVLRPVSAPALQAAAQPVLKFDSLCVGRGNRTLLDNVSLELKSGTTLFLTGPNGIGKSSLLRVLAGFEPALSGQGSCHGILRMVGQNPAHQFCRSSVESEIAADISCRKGSSGYAEEILTSLGLLALKDRSPFTLSEGEKRRLAVACAVAASPAVLLLDEPTVGLDNENRGKIAQALQSFLARGGAVICVTHDKKLIEVLGGETLNLENFATPHLLGSARQEVPARKAGRPLDVRVGFVWFLAGMCAVMLPLSPFLSFGFLALVLLSYAKGNRFADCLRFIKTLALFWLLPAGIFLITAGPQATLESALRFILVSLFFHRYAIAVDGRRLATSLSSWGLPYSAGFAFLAAWNQIPVLESRVKRIHEVLALRLTKAGKRSRVSAPGKNSRRQFSWRLLASLFLPVVVNLWEHAAHLAMSLELRCFQGKAPKGLPYRFRRREIGLMALAVSTAVILVIGGNWLR